MGKGRILLATATAFLALAGCTLEHVVKVGVWLDDARDFSSFNAVFKKHFSIHPPARSTVESPLRNGPHVSWSIGFATAAR